MRLTNRCKDLLQLLRSARWLSTGQVRRRFFRDATTDAARKRLRKLVRARYLISYQECRMTEAVFALGPEGKRQLERMGFEEISLERKPPKQFEHMAGIADFRITAELAWDDLDFFFACWELPAWDWHYGLIPDAVFSVRGKNFALEYDRGFENVGLFKRKIEMYDQGLDGLPLSAIIIVADSAGRMKALARGLIGHRCRVLYTTIKEIRQPGPNGPVFHRGPEDPGFTVEQDLLSASPTGERDYLPQQTETTGLRH